MDCEWWVGVEAQVLHKAPVGGIRQGGAEGSWAGVEGSQVAIEALYVMVRGASGWD